jgi:undecaprenyl-diphosphatase
MDAALFRFINHTLENPAFDVFFPWWTNIQRTATFQFALLPLILIATYYAFRWRGPAILALGALLTWAVDVLVSGLVKPLILRPRPFEALSDAIVRIPKPASTSFPSGHSTDAFFLASFLAVLYPRLWPLYYTVAVLIAFSRVYLGVHYPGDVLAGAVIGAGLGVFAASSLKRLSHGTPRNDNPGSDLR